MDYFFCGYRLNDEHLFEGIYQLAAWIGRGFCYELAGLAALVTINLGDTSAKLYHGDIAGKDHSWVECRELWRHYVIDLAWLPYPYIMWRSDYYKLLGERPIITSCRSYQQFAMRHTVNLLAERIRQPETSYIFKELQIFRNDTFFEETDALGRTFQPFLHGGKTVNADIFEKFINEVKLPKCG